MRRRIAGAFFVGGIKMLTIDDEGYVEALIAHANLTDSVQVSSLGLGFTLESKHRAQRKIDSIKRDLKAFEDILIKYNFIDKK